VKDRAGGSASAFFCVLTCFKIEKILSVKEMPYIVRDENGGERVSEFIPESRDPYEGYRGRDIIDFEVTGDPYRKGHRSWSQFGEDLRNRERMLEDAQRMSESIGSEIDMRPQPQKWMERDGRLPNSWDPSRRFENAERVNQTREEMRVPYSEEEVNARKWGLLNSLVEAIKSRAKDFYERRPEVERDLQGNIISETGVNENLLELYRNRPDLLRK